MSKQISFLLLIASLHLLFTLASVGDALSHEAGGLMTAPLPKLLLSPLYYPFMWNHILPRGFVFPTLVANSLLWGVMAERLVFGRKKILVRRAKKQ